MRKRTINVVTSRRADATSTSRRNRDANPSARQNKIYHHSPRSDAARCGAAAANHQPQSSQTKINHTDRWKYKWPTSTRFILGRNKFLWSGAENAINNENWRRTREARDAASGTEIIRSTRGGRDQPHELTTSTHSSSICLHQTKARNLFF